VVPGTDIVVTLDLVVTPELEAEGLARDVVRLVNELRRAEGLDVSDRIHLVIDTGHHADVRAALEANREFAVAEVLATSLVLPDDGHRHPERAHRVELGDGRAIHIAVSKS
jgi:isoleucyl-tRNA synthetase